MTYRTPEEIRGITAQIRDETTRGANTRGRIADALQDIADSPNWELNGTPVSSVNTGSNSALVASVSAGTGMIDSRHDAMLLPRGDGLDDSPNLAALIVAEKSGVTRRILLAADTYTWLSHVDVTNQQLSGITIECHPDTVHNGTLPYTDSWIGEDVSVASPTTTVAVSGEIGDITVQLTSGAAFAVDSYITFVVAGGRAMFRATGVNSNTVTLDAPLWFAVPGGSNVFLRTPARGFSLHGNGCIFRWTFTGVFQDQRVVELIETCDCKISGCRVVTMAGAPQAVFGFDQGGFNNVLDDLEISGLGTGVANVDAVAFEAQRGGMVRNIRSRDINAGPWINSCFGSLVENIENTNVNYGLYFSTLDTGNPIPNRRLTIRGLKVSLLSATGTGFAAGQQSCLLDSDADEISIDGGTTASNCAIDLSGSASDVRFGRVSVANTGSAVRAAASQRVTIGQLTVDNVASLASLVSLSDVSISKVRGTLRCAAGTNITIGSQSELRISDMALTLDYTSGANTWCNISGTLKMRDCVLTKTGAGTASYGFLNTPAGAGGIPGARVTLQDCEMGAWSSNFANTQSGDEIQLLGKVSYSGSVVNTLLSRQTVTLAGATAQLLTFPRATSASEAHPRRLTTGGAPGASPLIVITQAYAEALQDLSTITGISGITQPSLGQLREDGATSSHYWQDTVDNWVNVRPILLRIRAQAVGRNCIAVNDGGTPTVRFNLSTGAFISATGTGVTGYVVQNAGGAGVHDCYCYVPSWSTAALYIYLSTDGSTLSYLGGGSGVGVNLVAVESKRMGYASISGIAGDTSQYSINLY